MIRGVIFAVKYILGHFAFVFTPFTKKSSIDYGKDWIIG